MCPEGLLDVTPCGMADCVLAFPYNSWKSVHIYVRLHGVTLCSKKSSSCYRKVWSVSFFCSSIYESFPCLLRGTEFGFLKCCHLLPSTYQIITLFVGAMNPYRNRTFYLYVSFCQYQSELLNGSLHVSPAVQRWAAPTQPMLAAGSCVCFGQAFNLFYDPCLTLSGREQRVSTSIIRLV